VGDASLYPIHFLFNGILVLQTKQCFVFAHIPPLNMAKSMSPGDSKTISESKIQKTV
jgi:hypothetical protein